MSPVNANPVRGSINVLPETDPAEAAANSVVSLASSTEGQQAIGSIVPPGGLHPIAGGTATAATLGSVISDVAKDIGEALNVDPPGRPKPPGPQAPSGKVPFLVVGGGLRGVCFQ